MNIVKDYIPVGRRNRPGHQLRGPYYITVHSTANTAAGANAKMHGNYLRGAAANIPASWHFTVDSKEIRQHLPVTEVGWHAGDGSTGTGNRESIALEICENKDGDQQQAIKNAAWLVAKLLQDHGLGIEAVKQHYDWSGKPCPRILRNKLGGWSDFLAMVKGNLTEDAPGGGLYRVQVGAYRVKANADDCLKRVKAVGFTDAFIIGGSASTPEPQPAPFPAVKVGSKVKVRQGAADYNGTKLASHVYGNTYDVLQINEDRVVIGLGKKVTAAVKLRDLTIA